MTQTKLLFTRRFLPLFATQFLGAFNDNFFKNALVMLVTFQAATVMGFPPAQIVAVAGGIFILPFFLFSAQAGQLADKFEKAGLIKWIKAAELGIMVLACYGFVYNRLELLLGGLFLMGLHSTFFGPIKYSILPQHLTSDELVGGNALIEAATFVAILLGTIGGGVLVLQGEPGKLWVGVLLVAIAILGFLTSLFIPKAEAVAPGLKIKWNPVTPTWEIVQFTRRTRSVFLSILGISWFWFFGAFLLSIFPSYAKDFLQTDARTVTLFLALFSVGIAVGSLCCERMSRQQLELGLVPLGSLGISFFMLDLFRLGAAETWRISIDLFLIAVFGGFFIVPLYTLVQTRSEATHRSRIIAGNNIINALFMVGASGVLVLFLQAKLAVPEMFLVIALMNAIVAIYIYTLVPEFFLRFIAWMIANVMYRLKVTGTENIPRTGPAVLICNHVSFVDWMIIAAGVKRPIRFIMDAAFAKGPIMGMLVRQAKVIPILPAKVDAKVMEEAFAKAASELRAGELVCVFPEGKITFDGELNPFRPGIERLIRETPVPVVPLALVNMWGSLFSRKGGKAILKRPKRFWSRIELRIGPPISPEKVKAAYLQEVVGGMLL